VTYSVAAIGKYRGCVHEQPALALQEVNTGYLDAPYRCRFEAASLPRRQTGADGAVIVAE
jgi:hypothetical protein